MVGFKSVETFYRRASHGDETTEDRVFINLPDGMVGVADGVSEAYSPSNKALVYPGGLSGGAIAATYFTRAGNSGVSLVEALHKATEMVELAHIHEGKFCRAGDDVGGCTFSACQLLEDERKVHFILAGDCFALYKKGETFSFLTGVDEAAEQTEKEDKKTFEECKKKTGGKITGETWDLYHPHFKARKIRCSNKLIGKGGYPILNGDPALFQCWYESKIDLDGLDWILLGTDGIIPTELSHDVRAKRLGERFDESGFPGLVALRDELDYQPHMSKGAYPEGTGVVIRF